MKKYRTNCNGFENAKITANESAKDLDVEPVFDQKRSKKAKKMFDYESNNDFHRINGEDSFKQEYFIVILDQAIISMEERFIQYRWYEENFGFYLI